jgi:lysozyme
MKSFKSFCVEDCGCKYYKKSKKQKQVEEAFLSNKGKSFAKHLAIGAMAGAIPLAATLAGHTQKEKPTTIGNRVVSQVSPAPKPQVQQPQAQPESQHTDLSHGLIKHFEGFRTNAYSDKLTKSGVATIGWGMTKHPDGRPVKLGDTVTREEADKHLASHVEGMRSQLSKSIPNWDKMQSHQQAAVTSFAHNFGTGFYGKKGFETISGKLSDSSKWHEVPSAMSLYNKSGGQVRSGLTRRRSAEGAMWQGKVSGFNQQGEPTYSK